MWRDLISPVKQLLGGGAEPQENLHHFFVSLKSRGSMESRGSSGHRASPGQKDYWISTKQNQDSEELWF